MDLSLLISSLSAAKDIGGLLVHERDRQKAAAIQIELTEQIVQAQAQLSEVLAAIIEKDAALARLSDRCRQLETAQSEKARYQLGELAPGGGALAYRLRPAAELGERQDEPPHFVCQPCLDAGKRGVLIRTEVWGSWVYRCPLCRGEWGGGQPGR